MEARVEGGGLREETCSLTISRFLWRASDLSCLFACVCVCMRVCMRARVCVFMY